MIWWVICENWLRIGFRNEFLTFTSENEVDLDELHILKITFRNVEILWEILVENSCGKILWENLAGNSCRKILRENLAGKSCGKILWEILAGNSCGKFLWENLAGNAVGNSPYLSPNHF